MNLRTLTVFFWGFLIATAAVAGEEHRTHIKVVVDNDGKDHKTFEFDSDKSDIDLHGMALGESQTLTGDDGQDITVLRTESGFEIDIDGEKIEMMDFSEDIDIDGMHKMHESENVIVHIDDCNEGNEGGTQVKRKVRVIKKEVDVTN